MNEFVACGDHHSPWNIAILLTYFWWNVRCRLANEFKTAQSCIVSNAAIHKTLLVKTIGIAGDIFGKTYYIGNIKSPFTLR